MADPTESAFLLKLIAGVAVISSLAGAIFAVYVVKKLFLLHSVGVEMIRINKRLRDLEVKFTPNGGSSLDDVIRKTGTRLSQVVDTLAMHEQKLYVMWATKLEGIYESDAITGDVVWVNPAFCELFGLDAAGMLGRGWLRGVVKEERENVLLLWNSCLKNKIPFEAEFTATNIRTHEKFKVTASSVKTIMKDGSPVTQVGIIKRKVE